MIVHYLIFYYRFLKLLIVSSSAINGKTKHALGNKLSKKLIFIKLKSDMYF